MKRVNSSSWKKPFERDNHNSQDSAISSQGIQNSQCLEFSQVSTQDLFGQSTESQNDMKQSSQKMSMYEKWLSKRSISKHNLSDFATGSRTLQQNQAMLRNEGQYLTSNLGQGKSVIKNTPSQNYNWNKLKAGEKDECDLLEQIINRFQENKHEMRSFVASLKENFETMGGNFTEEAKVVLSAFMEEISKTHDRLVSQMEANKSDKSVEIEYEKQLASKNCQISSLESKLTVLEKSVNEAKAAEKSNVAQALHEEMKSIQLPIINKLEEITEEVGCQKQYVGDCKNNIDELKGQFESLYKKVQKDVKESESRILKEIRKVPKDVKNAVNVRSEVLSCIQGIPAEIEQSSKFNLDCMAKDLKSELSKEQKKHNEQYLRKQFDKMYHKMDLLVDEHDKMQQFVEAGLNESVGHHLAEICNNMKQLKDKSFSGSPQIKQLEQSVARGQEEHSKQLQNIIIQLKEFLDKFAHSKSHTKSKPYVDSSSAFDGNYNLNPSDQTYNQNSEFPNEVMKRNYVKTQSSELIERNYTIKEINYRNQNSGQYSHPSKKMIQEVENNLKTTPMPITKQPDIYPCHTQYRFKSPLGSVVNSNNLIQVKSQDHKEKIPFLSPFKSSGSFMNYSKHGPSPVAAIKPQRHNGFNPIQERCINHKESDQVYEKGKKLPEETTCSKRVFSKSKNAQDELESVTKIGNNQKSYYWLRKKDPQIYNEDVLYVRQTLQRSKKVKQFGSTEMNSSLHRKRLWLETQERREEGKRKNRYDYSIYDFEDDKVNDSTKENSIRSKSLHRQEDFEKTSQNSSPALTLDFDWAQTPSLKRKMERMFKPDCAKKRKINNLNVALLTDLHGYVENY